MYTQYWNELEHMAFKLYASRSTHSHVMHVIARSTNKCLSGFKATEATEKWLWTQFKLYRLYLL